MPGTNSRHLQPYWALLRRLLPGRQHARASEVLERMLAQRLVPADEAHVKL